MQHLKQDIAHAFHLLWRRPGFTVTALLSVVLGIGLNTAVFSIWDRLFLDPLPVSDTESLVMVPVIWRTESGEYVDFGAGHSFPNYLDLQAQNRSFEGMALYQWSPMSITGGSEPERVIGTFVTANYFDVLGLRPFRGRFFLPEEGETPGTSSVAVLSHGCWRRLFGADPETVGRTVRINGESFTVVGIAPPRFSGIDVTVSPELWVPVTMYSRLGSFAEYFDVRGVGLFPGFGRLRPGVSRDQAGDDLMRISRELEAHGGYNDGLGASVEPILAGTFPLGQRDKHLGYGKTLALGVALILLIACVNVAILLLLRGMERSRELALRQALGAQRRRLVVQLLTENLLLFILGGALSIPAGRALLELLWRFRPPEFAGDTFSGVTLDPRIFAFTLAIAVLTGLFFGLLPAFAASRPDLVASLNPHQSGATHGGGMLLHRVLTTLQVALALGVLVYAGLYARSLQNANNVDVGFAADRLLALSLAPGDQGYDESRSRELYRRVLEKIRALPGVSAAALSENRLLRGGVFQQAVWVDGHDQEMQIHGRTTHRTNAVTPGYFDTADIPLIAGQDFDETIRADGPPVAIINKSMADLIWPGQDAVGQHFRFNKPTEPLVKVIGVAQDAKYRNVYEPEQFFIYLSEKQRFVRAMTLHVRIDGDADAMLATVREEIRELAQDLPLADARPMREFVADDLWFEHTSAAVLGLFGLLASALAALGVYGVLSQAVSQRRREIGIRMAVGARHSHVLQTVLAEGLKVIAFGIVAGLVVAFVALKLSTTIASQLHDVSVLDPLIYGFAAVLLVVAAAFGCLVPTRRALRVDPVATLRGE